jgi:hypothetical protein
MNNRCVRHTRLMVLLTLFGVFAAESVIPHSAYLVPLDRPVVAPPARSGATEAVHYVGNTTLVSRLIERPPDAGRPYFIPGVSARLSHPAPPYFWRFGRMNSAVLFNIDTSVARVEPDSVRVEFIEADGRPIRARHDLTVRESGHDVQIRMESSVAWRCASTIITRVRFAVTTDGETRHFDEMVEAVRRPSHYWWEELIPSV